jgi:hypothetical protein
LRSWFGFNWDFEASKVSNNFTERFDQHGAWRREFALRLKLLRDWLGDHDLLDPSIQDRLGRVETQVRTDKVMVAFVAEFSRGKSELINALFFAGYKRRIMPASAGRTTMCPTELGYDADTPPCLRLLRIETRLQPQPLMEWRLTPEKWEHTDLDVDDPVALAKTLEKVAEVNLVSVEEARALGFWHDEKPEDNPPQREDGSVEVPRWRHALINIAHPLLKQGLVILDTPGLNAIGAEPELTVNLIPQAQAVLFILGADTGVTKSDLAIWKEHLITERVDTRYVVLNKIDTLWDELSTPEQIEEQIGRQRRGTAEILGIEADRVLAVSAQKGLVGKVNGDKKLLAASRMPELELALADGLIAQRERILRMNVSDSVSELRSETNRLLNIRKRDLAEQMVELKGLRGKNTNMIRHMRERIVAEHTEFDSSLMKIHAMRSVHGRLLKEVFGLLSSNTLRAELTHLNKSLRETGFKLGVTKVYGDTFDRLREGLARAQESSLEIHAMLAATFRQLNSDYGFTLQVPPKPDMARYERDLDLVQRSHAQYLGGTNRLRLASNEFVERLVRALATRLRMVFESAQGDIEIWNKTAASQLDGQMRERRRTFAKRLDAVDRVQDAASHLDERIAEINSGDQIIADTTAKLDDLTARLLVSETELKHPDLLLGEKAA